MGGERREWFGRGSEKSSQPTARHTNLYSRVNVTKNGSKRKIVVVPKISTLDSFRKLMPAVMNKFHAALVSDRHLKKM